LDAPSPLISIIVPVYNEERTVTAVIERLLAIDLPAPREIIVVNDGSRDDTAAVLDRLAGRSHLTVLHADRNRGKGHAIRMGFARARGTVFAIQDADLELDPAQLADLVAPILRGEAGVVYGSRFLTGTSPTPWLSRTANGALTAFTNLLHGASLTDMETCYKIMRSDVARSLDLAADRFDIEPEITSKLLLAGHEIVERPVSFTPRSRAAGKKIGWRDGVIAVKVLYRLRPPGALLTRTLMLIALVAVVVALTMIVGSGFGLRIGGRWLPRAHSVTAPLAAAIAAIALVAIRGREQVRAASRWWWNMIAPWPGRSRSSASRLLS
jgi:glycosyltransferase involved in cell wall biosynthesis